MHLYIGRDPHPCSNTLDASSEFGAKKKRWDFYWTPVFPPGGSRTTSWKYFTTANPFPLGGIYQLPGNSRSSQTKDSFFQQKYFNWKKNINMLFACSFFFSVLESHFHSWFPNHRLVKTSVYQPQIFTTFRLQIPPNSHFSGASPFGCFQK